MEYVRGDEKVAIDMLAQRLIHELQGGQKVLWLIPGGSNIPLSVGVLRRIKADGRASSAMRDGLMVTLTDERFGPVGHADSNWRQLIAAGFDFSLAQSSPVLSGIDTSLAETVGHFTQAFEALSKSADVVIGQFGMGADGHIAGALPGSPAIASDRLAVGYSAPQFERITLTLKAFQNIDAAYVFAFGESKRDAIEKLERTNAPLTVQPAQIVKSLKEAYLVTDQS